MTDYTEDVLRRLQDLLVLLPATTMNGCGPGAQGTMSTPLLTHDDQLFIFETAGLLITSGNFDAERKRLLMHNLVSPILDKFAVLLDELICLSTTAASAGAQETEVSRSRREVLAQCLSHAMSAVAWSSKTFNNAQTIKASGCLPVYLNALEIFLRAIQVTRYIDHIY